MCKCRRLSKRTRVGPECYRLRKSALPLKRFRIRILSLIEFIKQFLCELCNKGENMSQRDDVVAAGVAAVQAGQVAVLSDELGKAFDSGEAIGTGPGFTQADIDAAVLAAVDPLNAQIAQDKLDLDAAHADADQKLAGLQALLDAAIAQDNIDKAVVVNFQSALSALQASLDAFKSAIPA